MKIKCISMISLIFFLINNCSETGSENKSITLSTDEQKYTKEQLMQIKLDLEKNKQASDSSLTSELQKKLRAANTFLLQKPKFKKILR